MTKENSEYKNRPDTWKQAARGELSPGEYEDFLNSMGMKEYVDFKRDKENRLGEKEEYLDSVASRTSELKMDGSPLGNEHLLGDDLEKGAELFQLQEFSPQVQTDILLSLAYFRTPGFEKRAAQSLGYDDPEVMPSYRGDTEAMYQYIMLEMHYPDSAIAKGIEGRVVTRFVVEKDGRLTNFEVLYSKDSLLTEEALRILKKMPPWIPAKNKGKDVRSRFCMPVPFRLNNP